MSPWHKLFKWRNKAPQSDLDRLLGLPDEEVLAHVQALRQRRSAHIASGLSCDGVEINLFAREARVDGAPLPLGPKEYLLLEFLVLKRGSAVSKAACLTHLYGTNHFEEGKTIDVVMCRLRKQLAPYGLADIFETVWGFGYRFSGPALPIRSTPVAKGRAAKGRMAAQGVPERAASVPPVPRVGQLFVCLFVRPDRQQDRLGDFEELFRVVWVPRFGPKIAAWVYTAQAMRAAVSTLGVGVVAATLGHIWAALGR
jgi:DNA-binding winged helix-turn-helix (wHTH) protein